MHERIKGADVPPPHDGEVARPVYDKTTIALHWATAGLVGLLWLMGRTTGFLPRGPLRIDIWSLHIVLGFMLVGIVFGRIIWRAQWGHRPPPSDHGVRHLLAVTTHTLLYLLLLSVTVLGILNVFAHAFPLFGIWHFPKLGSADFHAWTNHWHNLAANLIALLALFHAAAALFHHYIVRDGLLHRMHPKELRRSHLESRDRSVGRKARQTEQT